MAEEENYDVNFANWSKDNLLKYIREFGFEEDLEDYGDILALAISIKESADLSHASTTSSIHEPIPDILKQDIIDIYDNTTGNNTDMLLKQPEIIDLTNENDMDDLTQEKVESIISLCEVTGQDFEEAKESLKQYNWNLNSVISSYFETHEIQQSENTETRENQNISRRIHQDTSMGTNPIFTDAMNSLGIGYDGNNIFRAPFVYDEDEEIPMPRDEYDEDGIRKPDPVVNRRLLGGRSNSQVSNGFESTLGRAEDPNVEWLFSPPNYLSFPGSFNDARSLCNEELKWVLTNIQSHEVFFSHRLNETWKNETIESIIRSYFVFWQRGNTSPDAKGFMSMYNIRNEDLPNISVIDPRTGARVLVIKGFLKPEDLSAILMEFVESNSLDDNSIAPNIKYIDARSWDEENDSSSIPPVDEIDYPISYINSVEKEDIKEISKEPVIEQPNEEVIPCIDYGPLPDAPCKFSNVFLK